MKLALDRKLVEVALAATKLCEQNASDGKVERIRVAVLCAEGGDVRGVHAARALRAFAITEDSADASSDPLVLRSAVSANSGGHSFAVRSCESRPFEMPSFALKAVNVTAPSAARYSSKVIMQ
jgi:hypothetical protein